MVNSRMAASRRVLYRAGWQRAKVDALSVLFVVGTFAVLAIEGETGWILFGFGILALAGLAGYRECYVNRIERSEDGEVEFEVLGVVRPRVVRLKPRGILDARYQEGAYRGVRAPWTTIRVLGRRWPLLLDEQGTFEAPEEVDRLLRRAPPRGRN